MKESYQFQELSYNDGSDNLHLELGMLQVVDSQNQVSVP